MPSTLALLDANVLYPFTLRDTLLRAADRDYYQPRWTDEILDEVTRNLTRSAHLTPSQTRHLVREMNLAFPTARVDGFHHLISKMENETKDRHVAAAAVHAGCIVIVTNNIRDFQSLAAGVQAVKPDDFLCALVDTQGDEICLILEEQTIALRNPPRTLADVLQGLRSVAPRFVERVQRRLQMSLRSTHHVIILRTPQ